MQNTGARTVEAGDLADAVANMASDLRKHEGAANPIIVGLTMLGMMYVTGGDKAGVQRWIERFR